MWRPARLCGLAKRDLHRSPRVPGKFSTKEPSLRGLRAMEDLCTRCGAPYDASTGVEECVVCHSREVTAEAAVRQLADVAVDVDDAQSSSGIESPFVCVSHDDAVIPMNTEAIGAEPPPSVRGNPLASDSTEQCSAAADAEFEAVKVQFGEVNAALSQERPEIYYQARALRASVVASALSQSSTMCARGYHAAGH